MKARSKRKIFSMRDVVGRRRPKSRLIKKKIRIDERILNMDRKREEEMRARLLQLIAENELRILRIRKLRQAARIQRLREMERKRRTKMRKEEIKRAKELKYVTANQYRTMERAILEEQRVHRIRSVERMRRRLLGIRRKENIRWRKFRDDSVEVKEMEKGFYEPPSIRLANKSIKQIRRTQRKWRRDRRKSQVASVERIRSVQSVRQRRRRRHRIRKRRRKASIESTISEPIKETKKKPMRRVKRRRKKKAKRKSLVEDIIEVDDERKKLQKKRRKRPKKIKRPSIEFHTVDYVAEREKKPPKTDEFPPPILEETPLLPKKKGGISKTKMAHAIDEIESIIAEPEALKDHKPTKEKPGTPEAVVAEEQEIKPVEISEAPTLRRKRFRKKREAVKGTSSEDSGLPRSKSVGRRRKLTGRLPKSRDAVSEDSGMVRSKKSFTRRKREKSAIRKSRSRKRDRSPSVQDTTYAKEGEEAAMQKRKRGKPIPLPKRYKNVKRGRVGSDATESFNRRVQALSDKPPEETKTLEERIRDATTVKEVPKPPVKQEFRRISAGPEDIIGERSRLHGKRGKGEIQRDAFAALKARKPEPIDERRTDGSIEMGTPAGSLRPSLEEKARAEAEKVQQSLTSLERVEKRAVGSLISVFVPDAPTGTVDRVLGDVPAVVDKLREGAQKLPTILDRIMDGVVLEKPTEPEEKKMKTRTTPIGPESRHDMQSPSEKKLERSKKGKKGKKIAKNAKERIRSSNEEILSEVQKVGKSQPPAEGAQIGNKSRKAAAAAAADELSKALTRELTTLKKRRKKGLEILPDTAEMKAGRAAKKSSERKKDSKKDKLEPTTEDRLGSIIPEVIRMPTTLQAIESPVPPPTGRLIDVLEDVQRMKRIRAETLKKYTSKERAASDRAKVPLATGRATYGRLSVKDPASMSSDVFASQSSRRITRSRLKAFKKQIVTPQGSWLHDSEMSLDAWNAALEDLISQPYPEIIEIPAKSPSQRSSEIIRGQKKMGILSIFRLFEPCKEEKPKEYNRFEHVIPSIHPNCFDKLLNMQKTSLRPSSHVVDVKPNENETSPIWSQLSIEKC